MIIQAAISTFNWRLTWGVFSRNVIIYKYYIFILFEYSNIYLVFTFQEKVLFSKDDTRLN